MDPAYTARMSRAVDRIYQMFGDKLRAAALKDYKQYGKPLSLGSVAPVHSMLDPQFLTPFNDKYADRSADVLERTRSADLLHLAYIKAWNDVVGKLDPDRVLPLDLAPRSGPSLPPGSLQERILKMHEEARKAVERERGGQ